MIDSPDHGRPYRKFNPGSFQSDAEVIDQFVVRNRELTTALEILRGNVDSPSCQHVLAVAPRGRGKTMLLARVAAELRTAADLSGQFLPVRFMEESHEVFNSCDFWLETLFHLARELHAQAPEISRELRGLHDDFTAGRHSRDLEARARAAVLDTADRLGKQLVLMVENLQALCRDTDQDFGWQFRNVLQSDPQVILLATATSRFRELDDAEHAFFELFRILRLEPLDSGECRRLWQAVTGADVAKRSIRPLEILTGGDPRLLVIVAEFAKHLSVRQLMEDLVRLIDDHTEYFRGHLENLAKTERRVYLALIDLWQPSTTGEIAARARLDVRPVSTLLGRLVERGAVVSDGNGRKRLYSATQRLYSIYYKLRRERDEAAVVRNLIHFMAVFYADDELSQFADRLTLEAARSPKIRAGIEVAVAEAPQIGRMLANHDRRSTRRSPGQGAAPDHDGIIPGPGAVTTHNAIAESPESIMTADGSHDSAQRETSNPLDQARALRSAAEGCRRRGEYEAALSNHDLLISRFGENDQEELRAEVAGALVGKGHVQTEFGDVSAAIAAFDEVFIRFGDDTDLNVQAHVASGMFNKAVAQYSLGDARTAVETCDNVVARFGDNEASVVRRHVASALMYKGTLKYRSDDLRAALAAFGEFETRFEDSDEPEVRALLFFALISKEDLQVRLGDFPAAIATFDKVFARYGDSSETDFKLPLAFALLNKSVALVHLGDTRSAIATCDEVDARFDDNDGPILQLPLASALFDKAIMLDSLGDIQSALATFGEVVLRFGDNRDSNVREFVARSLLAKAQAELRIGKAQEALVSCEKLERQSTDLDEILRNALSRQSGWVRTNSLLLLEQHAAALDHFRRIYRDFVVGDDAMMAEVQKQVPKVIAAGASERDLVDILSGDSGKVGALAPLVVALRQRSGETVRAPAEVLEVASDIRSLIEDELASRGRFR